MSARLYRAINEANAHQTQQAEVALRNEIAQFDQITSSNAPKLLEIADEFTTTEGCFCVTKFENGYRALRNIMNETQYKDRFDTQSRTQLEAALKKHKMS